MYYLNSLKLITSRLHQLSSIAKLFIIGIFWFAVSFGQNIFPSITLNNQVILSIVITVTFVTNLVTEAIIYHQKHHNQDSNSVLEWQIIFNTFFLLFFLVLIDHINGPLFLICTLTLMESALNLNLKLPSLIVVITGTFTVVEWFLLFLSGQMDADLISIVALILRIVILVVLMGYGRSLSEAILAAKEVDSQKDEFVSIASHELRTPMTAVKSYLWMALSGRGGALLPKQKFYLRRSYESTDRLIKLVNDMLNISRIESGHISLEFSRINMNSLVKIVFEEFAARAKETKIKLVIHSDFSPVDVVADSDKIKEVFYNLISNSIKHTPASGTISVGYRQVGEDLITSLSDTGSGMTTQIIKNLFQKFGFIRGTYQTNQSSNTGTGLGLYICRQIITLHEGRIWGESDGINQGSTFSFSLPLYTPEKLKIYQKQFQHSSKVGIIHSKI